MLLKRFYKVPEGWVKELDKHGTCINLPPLDYVSLAHTGVSAKQNFSVSLVHAAIAEGWAKLEAKKLHLMVHPETLVYDILRMPGRHPAKNHAGYEVIHAYECVLNVKQHEKFRVKAPARNPRFPRKV
jgi:hypothetical protein